MHLIEQAARCGSFLRAVRDDRGAPKARCRGDQLVARRFEQCPSEEALAYTIPGGNLPFTSLRLASRVT